MHDSCRVFPDGSGSYDLAIKAAKHYKKYYNSNLGSKMTLSPNNINFTFPALINLWENGYDYIHANCVFEKGWTIEHARILYNELKKVANYLLENHSEKTKGTSILNLDLSE
ncbi:MAG: hypothetical protein PUH43_05790 [Clostridium sp.]|nr:hypothetical protein [Clostridium sp.]